MNMKDFSTIIQDELEKGRGVRGVLNKKGDKIEHDELWWGLN